MNTTSAVWPRPHPHTMLKTISCNFFWFSTLYQVGRGNSNSFFKGKQRCFQTSVVNTHNSLNSEVSQGPCLRLLIKHPLGAKNRNSKLQPSRWERKNEHWNNKKSSNTKRRRLKTVCCQARTITIMSGLFSSFIESCNYHVHFFHTKHLIKFNELLQQWRKADNDVESFTEQKYDILTKRLMLDGKWNLGTVNHSCKSLFHFVDDEVAGN